MAEKVGKGMKLLSEIYRDLIEKLVLVLIILLFCGYAVIVSPEFEEDDNSLADKFPIYDSVWVPHHPALSAKLEWLKSHGGIE